MRIGVFAFRSAGRDCSREGNYGRRIEDERARRAHVLGSADIRMESRMKNVEQRLDGRVDEFRGEAGDEENGKDHDSDRGRSDNREHDDPGQRQEEVTADRPLTQPSLPQALAAAEHPRPNGPRDLVTSHGSLNAREGCATGHPFG